ncbi:MAG: hypothetical protein SA378_10920 [Sedimentibacter sp.]|uniref:hypothetical protein n=1 Tax=Sedimentibacter sp. TaxID=1960295 RepID=UPI002981BEAE|nr:hypothetical protein [Sedimentibacter sp.]MDW5300630.1 hypothetical protein [Sedimentibacter sp.]
MTPIENIQTLTGFTDTAKINALIELTKKEIETYSKRVYNTLTMDSLLTEMVIFKVQKLGNEATKSLTYNDTTQSFLTDYPAYIIRQLDELKKKVRLL